MEFRLGIDHPQGTTRIKIMTRMIITVSNVDRQRIPGELLGGNNVVDVVVASSVVYMPFDRAWMRAEFECSLS